jgi:uncharacterized protein (TIGR02145 family)
MLFTLLLLAFAAYGQQEQVAIVSTVASEESIKYSDLNYLTVRLRELAIDILPQNRYGIMSTETITAMFGSQERAAKECSEASCLVSLGRKLNADYIAQGRIGRFEKDLTIQVELYSTSKGNMLGSFTGTSPDIKGLLSILNEKAPAMFKKLPGASVQGGLMDVKTSSGAAFELNERSYVASVNTEPQGASLGFNGVPIGSCGKTPCKAELAEGNVRIVAAMEQYETADTIVSIMRNNQSISIKLKPNFGILEIKPAYSDSIGAGNGWSLAINGKAQTSYENKLAPGNYNVNLSHGCYEDISFKAGINKGSREVFDMARHIVLKKGGLVLSVERDGEPASEPVFVNGKQAGETSFSGSVPICAKVEIGKGREAVDVKLMHNDKVKHIHKGGLYVPKFQSGKFLTDDRDGKTYRPVQIGKQMWMAENLNYNASGSKCYGNEPANCAKYGRLYNWAAAKAACPKGWHLPSKAEWDVLTASVGGSPTEGKYLKAASGWNGEGNGADAHGFAALPGGYGTSDNYFSNAGLSGYWWSASAYGRYMYYNYEGAYWINYNEDYLFSVRCLQN